MPHTVGDTPTAGGTPPGEEPGAEGAGSSGAGGVGGTPTAGGTPSVEREEPGAEGSRGATTAGGVGGTPTAGGTPSVDREPDAEAAGSSGATTAGAPDFTSFFQHLTPEQASQAANLFGSLANQKLSKEQAALAAEEATQIFRHPEAANDPDALGTPEAPPGDGGRTDGKATDGGGAIQTGEGGHAKEGDGPQSPGDKKPADGGEAPPVDGGRTDGKATDRGGAGQTGEGGHVKEGDGPQSPGGTDEKVHEEDGAGGACLPGGGGTKAHALDASRFYQYNIVKVEVVTWTYKESWEGGPSDARKFEIVEELKTGPIPVMVRGDDLQDEVLERVAAQINKFTQLSSLQGSVPQEYVTEITDCNGYGIYDQYAETVHKGAKWMDLSHWALHHNVKVSLRAPNFEPLPHGPEAQEDGRRRRQAATDAQKKNAQIVNDENSDTPDEQVMQASTCDILNVLSDTCFAESRERNKASGCNAKKVVVGPACVFEKKEECLGDQGKKHEYFYGMRAPYLVPDSEQWKAMILTVSSEATLQSWLASKPNTYLREWGNISQTTGIPVNKAPLHADGQQKRLELQEFLNGPETEMGRCAFNPIEAAVHTAVETDDAHCYFTRGPCRPPAASAKMLEWVYICNTHMTRDGQSCKDHPDGCGVSLRAGDLCKTTRNDAHAPRGNIWYHGTWKAETQGLEFGTIRKAIKDTQCNLVCKCRVGVVKCPVQHKELCENRTFYVCAVIPPPEKPLEELHGVQWLSKKVHGLAIAMATDFWYPHTHNPSASDKWDFATVTEFDVSDRSRQRPGSPKRKGRQSTEALSPASAQKKQKKSKSSRQQSNKKARIGTEPVQRDDKGFLHLVGIIERETDYDYDVIGEYLRKIFDDDFNENAREWDAYVLTDFKAASPDALGRARWYYKKNPEQRNEVRLTAEKRIQGKNEDV